MNEQANKILIELLQKAANGIDAAVSFSQAQIPDVIHQLLVWNFIHSVIITVMALMSIPLVIWLVKKQLRKVQIGTFGNEWYSWDKGNPKYSATLIWDAKGDLSFLILPLVVFIIIWGASVLSILTNPTWLKIWLAPKLYLIEYAASLVK
ncbi:TPA: hypothetical protein I8412_003744 [Citrobacter freundii]|nr:hypothetical protein [Citrobacter freundii]HAT2227528.1 hypothetical protein [Citrobacter freundii]HAT2569095.1 hypothetical protein [Citrobacter freundii]HAT2588612.1 hypothetical protein [Citrobacter freundii]HAT3025166.1 hypothetical protein [Citrobacter freundii]